MFNKKKFVHDRNFLRKIVLKSLKMIFKKVDYGEVFITKSIGHSVTNRNGKIENLEFNDDFSFSVIVYKNYRKGYAFSKSLKWSIIKKTIMKALFLSKQTCVDDYLKVPKKDIFYFKNNFLNLKIFNPEDYNLDKIFKLVHLTENIALNFNNKIVNSEGSNFYNNNSIIFFGNTFNIIKFYETSYYFLSLSIVAKFKNSIKSHYSYTISRNFKNLIRPKKLAYDCATRALDKLNSKKIFSRISKVIFSYEISYTLFNCLYKAIQGENVYSKSTFLLNFLNKKIFPSWFNIFESSLLKEGLGSRPFDNEGIFSKPKYIIKKGILKTWLLDMYFSNKLNIKNTANSGEMYNWILKISSKKNFFSFNSLLKKMNNGFLITELMGQGVDITNGNYSNGASGFWIKNGKISYPVSEITISGNLRTMFTEILGMSSDINKNSKIQSGSIFLKQMNISGL